MSTLRTFLTIIAVVMAITAVRASYAYPVNCYFNAATGGIECHAGAQDGPPAENRNNRDED